MTSFLPEQTAIQEVFGNEVSYHPLTPVVTVIHPGPRHPGIFDSQIRFISEESTVCVAGFVRRKLAEQRELPGECL